MIISIRLQQWQCGEPIDDLGLRLGSSEALQQFLKHQSGSDDYVYSEQGISELLHLWLSGFYITTESQGPNACIDEQRHLLWRDRSAL